MRLHATCVAVFLGVWFRVLGFWVFGFWVSGSGLIVACEMPAQATMQWASSSRARRKAVRKDGRVPEA